MCHVYSGLHASIPHVGIAVLVILEMHQYMVAGALWAVGGATGRCAIIAPQCMQPPDSSRYISSHSVCCTTCAEAPLLLLSARKTVQCPVSRDLKLLTAGRGRGYSVTVTSSPHVTNSQHQSVGKRDSGILRAYAPPSHPHTKQVKASSVLHCGLFLES